MGRADLIGNGKKQLIPAWQPATCNCVNGLFLRCAVNRRKPAKFQSGFAWRALSACGRAAGRQAAENRCPRHASLEYSNT
jgi:hypothetical protein